MARQNIVDGLVAQLRLTNGFEAGNSGTAVADDHRVLGMGVDRAAIVLANEGEQERLVMGKNALTHSLDIELYIRHNNDVVQARRDAHIYNSNIIARINGNSTLGGSAFDALVTGYRVEDESFQFGKVPFLKEVLTIKAIEDLTA